MALNPFQREVQAQLAGIALKLADVAQIANTLHHAIEKKLPEVDDTVLDVVVECQELNHKVAKLAALVQEIGSAE